MVRAVSVDRMIWSPVSKIESGEMIKWGPIWCLRTGALVVAGSGQYKLTGARPSAVRRRGLRAVKR
jgi:hypothetical protein